MARGKRKNSPSPTSSSSNNKNKIKKPETSVLFTSDGSSKPTRISVTSGIQTSNAFQILDGNDDEVIVTREKKKRKPPPITTTNWIEEEIHASLATMKITSYSIKHATVGIHIYITETEDFVKYVAALKESNKQVNSNKINFYTHDLPDQQHKKIVLRGLRKMDNNLILAELTKNEINFVVDIKVIYPKQPRYENHVNYILYLQRDADVKKLTSIHALFKTAIKWDRYRSIKRGPVQCYTCQRPGHGGRNCDMPERCLWCAGPHTAKNCKEYQEAAEASIQNQGASSNTPAVTLVGKCCNCQGDHFANDENCKFRQRYSDMRKRLSNSNRKEAQRYSHNPDNFDWSVNKERQASQPIQQIVNEGRPRYSDAARSVNIASVANAAREANVSQAPSANNSGDLFSLEEIMTITREIITRLENCKTKGDQLCVIYEVSAKYLCNHGCK